VLQLEKRIDADIIVARTLIAQKKKERALLALKKKKLSENQLQNIQSYLVNVEGMVSVIGIGAAGVGGSGVLGGELARCVLPGFRSWL
jgi:hypothetical protein